MAILVLSWPNQTFFLEIVDMSAPGRIDIDVTMIRFLVTVSKFIKTQWMKMEKQVLVLVPF